MTWIYPKPKYSYQVRLDQVYLKPDLQVHFHKGIRPLIFQIAYETLQEDHVNQIEAKTIFYDNYLSDNWSTVVMWNIKTN